MARPPRNAVRGASCRLVLERGTLLTELPFTEETLRESPRNLARPLRIGEGGHSGDLPIPSGSSGCAVSLLTPSAAPFALALALGSEGEPSATETPGTFLRRMTFTETAAFCAAYADRTAHKRCFPGLSCTGFQLRGMTGNPVYLRLDFQGAEPPVHGIPAPVLPGTTEAHLRYEALRFTVEDSAEKDIYGFSLSAERRTSDTALIQLTLHSVLTSRSAAWHARNLSRVVIDIPLGSGRIRIDAADLLLDCEGTTIDCADEIIGPTRYRVRGAFTADITTAGAGRLLP